MDVPLHAGRLAWFLLAGAAAVAVSAGGACAQTPRGDQEADPRNPAAPTAARIGMKSAKLYGKS
jgi:hypothetical protein